MFGSTLAIRDAWRQDYATYLTLNARINQDFYFLLSNGLIMPTQAVPAVVVPAQPVVAPVVEQEVEEEDVEEEEEGDEE